MRMTQEQFDSIKDRINLPINSITSFKKWGILINYDSGKYRISNVDKTFKAFLKELEYHETFSVDIFLEACRVEVEKTWKGSEMQIQISGIWSNCSDVNNYRLKPQPNYDKEIEALQQKTKENGMNVIINFEKL